MDFSLPCVLLPDNPIAESDRQVFFASGSTALTPEAILLLDRQFLALAQAPSTQIQVRGYADTREAPSSEDMFRLSQMRALMVRDYLIGKGVAEGRIQAIGGHGPILIPKKEDEATLSRMRVVITQPVER